MMLECTQPPVLFRYVTIPLTTAVERAEPMLGSLPLLSSCVRWMSALAFPLQPLLSLSSFFSRVSTLPLTTISELLMTS